MMRALWSAATGMQAQQTNMDVIANNLANVNTTGYKRSRADFQELLYQSLRVGGTDTSRAGTQVPVGIQMGHGVRLTSVSRVFSQGDFQRTENPMDVVIEGQGFFQVRMPSGELYYSRDGSFKVDSTGNIVTSDGYPIEPGFQIPDGTTDVTIGPDGTISVIQNGETQPANLGQIQLATFINPSGLLATGRNLYRETNASGPPTQGNPGDLSFGVLNQGYLEGSNVNMVEEMVNMITSQRAYEVNSRTIQTSDEMLQEVAGLKR